MKSVTDTLLERRSIRRYEYDPVTDAQMHLIHEAIRNTPTSYNGQQFSVIDITDNAVKEQLYALTNQKQIKTCSHFMVFCIDFHKIAVLAKAKGADMPPIAYTADGLFLGIIDASQAMMSAVVAAEAQGLGTCCVGYVRTASPRDIASLLRLPEGVMVVCGLAIGVPREMPDLKPKQPAALVIHRDTYRQDDMTAELQAYDSEVKEYNATRAGSKSTHDWCLHMLDYYREACGYEMLEALRSQGFDPKR